MNSNDLSIIFGETSIWDFYCNNSIESLKFDAQNNFITSNGTTIKVENIRVYIEYGTLSFEKTIPGSKSVKVSLIFIEDRSVLIGFEDGKQVKYIKTDKESFDHSF